MHRFFQKTIEFGFFFLFLTVPVVMFHQTSELFEFNKLLVIYLLTSAIVSAWLGKMVIEKRFIYTHTPITVFLLLFLAAQILSTVFSIDTHTSFFGYYGRFNGGLLSTFSYILLYVAFVSNIQENNFLGKKSALSVLLSSIIVGSVIVMLWGLPGKFGYDLSCVLFTGTLGNSCWTDQFHPEERMFSTLGQPNWLGAYLVVCFFIGVYVLFSHRNNRKVAISLSAYVLLTFVCIFFTRSRSAIVALFTGIIFLLPFLFRIRSTFNTRFFYLFTSILFITAFFFRQDLPVIGSYLTNNTTIEKQSALSSSSDVTQKHVTESFDIRKIVWQGAVELIKKYPVLGTGVETFAYSYYFVRPAAHNVTSEWDFVYNKAHNEFLNIGATGGLVSLLAYLLLITAVCIYFFAYLKKNTVSSNNNQAKFIFAVCISLGYLSIHITNFFGFSTTSTSIFFYLLPGLFMLGTQPPKKLKQEIPVTPNKIAIIPVVFFILCAVYIVRYFAADIVYAKANSESENQRYQQAVKLYENALLLKYEHVYEDKLSSAYAAAALYSSLESNPNLDTIQRNLTIAEERNKKTIEKTPKNVFYWKTRAKNHYIVYQLTQEDDFFEKAMQALDEAEKLAPTDPRIPYTKALFISSTVDQRTATKNELYSLQSALTSASKAAELKKNYRDGYFIKAQLYKQMGKKTEAKNELEYILKNIQNPDEEVQEEIKQLQ